MQKIVLYLLLSLTILFSGCNQSTSALPIQINKPNTSPVEVIIDGDGPFPQQLVGVWVTQDEQIHLGFKFKKDGSISKMLHGFAGEVNITGKPIYLEGIDPNNYATYVFAPLQITYNPDYKELSVKVELENYVMKIPGGILQGHSEDYFTGTITDDWKYWDVEWLNYSWLEGSTPPDPNIIFPDKLRFKKLSDQELTEYKPQEERSLPHKH